MTDQKAEVGIENVERYARVDTRLESNYLDMNPNPPETSKSMWSIIIDSTFLAFTPPGVELRFFLTFKIFEKLIHTKLSIIVLTHMFCSSHIFLFWFLVFWSL